MELVVYVLLGCGVPDHLKIHRVQHVLANSREATAVLSARGFKKGRAAGITAGILLTSYGATAAMMVRLVGACRLLVQVIKSD